MPKAQKTPKNAPCIKTRQITDFFSRKPMVSEGSSPSSSRCCADRGNAKQVASKENSTPTRYNVHSAANSGNGVCLNGSPSSLASRVGASSPVTTKAAHITSPMQPSAKRLRSQSIVSSRSEKQPKRIKNILCESRLEEDKVEVDEDSIVYVPAMADVSAPLTNTPSFLKVPSASFSISTSPLSEVSMVPSSLSDEIELDCSHAERSDAGVVQDVVDHWRQQALPQSPLTDEDSSPASRVQPQSDVQSSTAFDSDWNMDNDKASDATPSRPGAKTSTGTSFLTPPASAGPNSMLSVLPVEEVLDSKAKTEKLIQEIKSRARAHVQTHAPPSPLSDIPSLDSSDDDDDDSDGLAILGLKDTTHLSPVKAKSPTKHNLRKPGSKLKANSKIFTPLPFRETSPSPQTRRRPAIPPAVNPLDALLGEKRELERKSSATSADREARLRALSDLNLDDEMDEDSECKIPGANGPGPGNGDGNPFIDEQQKRQVMKIFMGDKAIEDEEEHLHQRGMVGVTLWNIADPFTIDTYDDVIPPLDYQGVDPVLKTLAEAISHGDLGLLRLVMQSGTLELANYSDGQAVIDYLISLALSIREDGLDLSALRLLPHVLCNDRITTPIVLFECVLTTLCKLGAEPSVLEKLGWMVEKKSPRPITDGLRTKILERLVLCITDVARSNHFLWREIGDLATALILIGVESTALPEIRLLVSTAIHEVCQAIGETDQVEVDPECAISNAILRLVQPYSVQNKLYALNLISDAGGRTARIARVVAHAMLTDKSVLLPSQYSAFPPLEDLLVMLSVSKANAVRPAGKFAVHDGADYVDMACWTSILAVAITGMANYVEVDESTKKPLWLSQSLFKEKDESIFEHIQRQLWIIHNRIQDTRAAHLDRSQTKAILAHTAFRILYQYQSIAQCRKTETTNLQRYFSLK